MKQPETILREQIFASLGCDPDLLVLRNAVGQDSITHVVYGLGTGSADLIVILRPWGHVLGLEIKVPGKKMRENQRATADVWRDVGATVCEVTSVEAALAVVERTREYLRARCPWVGAVPVQTGPRGKVVALKRRVGP